MRRNLNINKRTRYENIVKVIEHKLEDYRELGMTISEKNLPLWLRKAINKFKELGISEDVGIEETSVDEEGKKIKKTVYHNRTYLEYLTETKEKIRYRK